MYYSLFPNLMNLLRSACTDEAEYAPARARLTRAGLSERRLRKMDPDQRVAALERANLDPYDYIYLAC